MNFHRANIGVAVLCPEQHQAVIWPAVQRRAVYIQQGRTGRCPGLTFVARWNSWRTASVSRRPPPRRRVSALRSPVLLSI